MTIADTLLGQVRGQVIDGLHVFRSIPYAESTAGEHRFKPARPKAAWAGVLDALEPRAVAPQLQDVAYEMAGASVQHLCNEDCLELNVWTPGVDDRARPVMVYIHGGGYLYGSSHDADYNGADLAKAGDVVVITINYRLGIFAHLYLGHVGGEEFQDSGALSVTDQTEALCWIKANIASFGGDPGNITIFGESCGGLSVSHLTASPLAKGLFQRMIAMSGAGAGRGIELGESVTNDVLAHAGVKSVVELQALSMSQMLDLQAWALENLGLAEATFIPVIGPSPALPADPMTLIAQGAGAEVDMLIGFTKDEGRFWHFYYPEMLEQSPARVAEWAAGLFGDKAADVLDTYAKVRPHETPAERSSAIVGDIILGYLSDQQALRHGKHNPRTWMYRLDWRTSGLDGKLGAPHSCDLPFVFDAFDTSWGQFVAEDDNAARRRVLNEFQGAFLAFARTGDPNHPGLPQWRSYDAENRWTMLVGGEAAVCVSNPNALEFALWDEVIGADNLSEATRYFQFCVEGSYPTNDAVTEAAKVAHG